MPTSRLDFVCRCRATSFINKGIAASDEPDHRHSRPPRNLGGTPDLGAYEAVLPEAGRVYYVRENGGVMTTTAFRGKRPLLPSARRWIPPTGAQWLMVRSRKCGWRRGYAQDPFVGSQNCFEIKDGVNVYGAFPATGTPGMDDRHPLISAEIYYDPQYNPAKYETIIRPLTADNDVRRVLGQADRYNPANELFYSQTYTSYEYVGAGNGDYAIVSSGYHGQEGGGWVYSETGGYTADASSSLYTHLHVDTAGYCQVGQSDDPTHKYADAAERTAYSDWAGTNIIGTGGYGEDPLDFVRVGSGAGEYNITSEWKSFEYNSRYL